MTSGWPTYVQLVLARMRRNRPRLFVPQSDHRIYAHGAARGDVAGENADQEHQGNGGGQRKGIGRLQTEKQAGNPLPSGEDQRDANRSSNQDKQQGFAKNEPEDAAALRTERDADADFVGAAGRGIGHDSVKSYANEDD